MHPLIFVPGWGPLNNIDVHYFQHKKYIKQNLWVVIIEKGNEEVKLTSDVHNRPP